MSRVYIVARRNLWNPPPGSLQNFRVILWNLNEPNGYEEPTVPQYTDPTTGIEWKFQSMEPEVLEIAGFCHEKSGALEAAETDYIAYRELYFHSWGLMAGESWETIKSDHFSWTGSAEVGGQGFVWDIFSIVLEHRKTIWVPPNP